MRKRQKHDNLILISITIILLIFIGYLIVLPGDFNNKINKLFSDNDFVASNTMLKFNPDIIDYLYESWDNNLNNEYGACLNLNFKSIYKNEAIRDYSLYIIDEKVYYLEGKENFVSGLNCYNYDVMLHSHPEIGCKNQLWNGDITSAKRFYESGGIFFLIQCEKDKVEVYTRDDMLNGKIISLSENIYSEEIQ